MAKVYIASRFGRQIEMRSYAASLISKGHEVTSSWLWETGSGSEAKLLEHPETASQFALRDSADLLRADRLLLFSDGQSYGGGGRHVELGIAIGRNRPVTHIGPKEHLYHCWPTMQHYPDWAHFLQESGWVAQ